MSDDKPIYSSPEAEAKVGLDARVRTLTTGLLPMDLIRHALWRAGDYGELLYCKLAQANDVCNFDEVDDRDRSMIYAGCLLSNLGHNYTHRRHAIASYGIAFNMLD